MKKEINIYKDFMSWMNEAPDAVITGSVESKNSQFIEIIDENGYTQIINLDKLFAIVY